MTKQREQHLDVPAGVHAGVNEEERPIAIVQNQKGYLQSNAETAQTPNKCKIDRQTAQH
jgi:hypothetical protein